MVIKEILNRRAVREFQNKEVPDELIKEVIKAGQFAPTGRNNKAVEFVVVKDLATKEKIFAICGQEFVRTAPVLIIPATDETKTGLPAQDLSVATENIFVQAAAFGLGTVWKNLQPDWAQSVKKLLQIPENFKIINLIPLGYPAKEPVPHYEEEFSEKKIHKEKW
jgi:nitroreductase